MAKPFIPPCFVPQSFGPGEPIRNPLTRGDAAACVADMACVMAEISRGWGEGTVTRDDLHRAGFTNAEIDRHHPEVVVACRALLAPRRMYRKAA